MRKTRVAGADPGHEKLVKSRPEMGQGGNKIKE